MLIDVASSRHLVGVDASLVFSGADQDGEPFDVGTVTAAVYDSSGAAVAAGPVVESGHPHNEVRTVVVSASNNLVVDQFVVVWTGDDGVLATTRHDVVGGYYCTVKEMRTDTVLGSDDKHSASALISDRAEVESMLNDACKRSFVPRFASEILSGSGHAMLQLANSDLREVVWADYWTGAVWAPMPAILSHVPADPFGRVVLRAGSYWPCGTNNIRIGYRYGWDSPPADLRRAVVKAVEARRTGDGSGIPSRAISVQGTELGNVVLATPGLGKWTTAIPEVDEVINRYRRRDLGVGI